MSHTLELPPRTRLTPQRQAVLDAVASLHGRFTLVEVYDRARRREPRLSLATVYRTVDLLRRTGSVRPLPAEGQATYVHCRRGHHHHLVCTGCGAVEETTLCAAPSAAELKARHGFVAASHELDIYGLCERCS
ncbi:MAG TPA: Fur family transcriptional regulator [Gaiellaceae bacterium]|jgi:Fe2+ or Zn2+ uptake regulation protein|nr:Fur family transcriptional regulator [Gaiellaceae bacterium]